MALKRPAGFALSVSACCTLNVPSVNVQPHFGRAGAVPAAHRGPTGNAPPAQAGGAIRMPREYNAT
jgi:hypothetical protein